jgi:hypothetical protein
MKRSLCTLTGIVLLLSSYVQLETDPNTDLAIDHLFSTGLAPKDRAIFDMAVAVTVPQDFP